MQIYEHGSYGVLFAESTVIVGYSLNVYRRTLQPRFSGNIEIEIFGASAFVEVVIRISIVRSVVIIHFVIIGVIRALHVVSGCPVNIEHPPEFKSGCGREIGRASCRERV